jgi:iron complex transport system substrate-binding protein
MNTMIRQLGIGLLLLTLLTACGGQAETQAPDSTPTDTPGNAIPPTNTAGAETRTIRHAMGETEVAASPQRIVSLNATVTDNLVALGITPIAIATFNGSDFSSYEYMAADLQGVPIIGTFTEPNQERIVQLKPDLIIGRDKELEEVYATLSQIAPTVAIEDQPDFRSWYKLVADAVGAGETANARLTKYEAKAKAARTALASATNGQTVVFLRVQPDSIRVYNDQRLGGPILYNELGLAQPAFVQALPDDTTFIEISLEEIPQLEQADHIFLLDQSEANTPAPLFKSPLWRNLPAVQNEQVYPADRDIWINLGLLATERVVEAVQQALIGQTPTGLADEGAPRRVAHAMGETAVPASPQRVVVLDTGELDNALALGANIVGAPVNDAVEYQGYLADQIEGITDIGAIDEPNLETILALRPDLILGSQQRYEEIYPELEQIAPTVFSASLRVPWQDNFRLHAEALGKTAEAEKLLVDYDARVAEVQMVLGERLDDTTISIIRFRPGQVRLYLKSSYIGYILQDVGVQRPPSQDEDAFSAEITLEQIAEVDADYIFITGYAQDDSELETFLESPLWQTLGAVQNNRAIDVNDDAWIAGLGVQSANAVLDDLISIFEEHIQ